MNMNEIRNIYCVGRNYRLHAAELGNKVPDAPFLFLKPTHALIRASGQEIVLPGDHGDVHHEVEFVIHISRPYKNGMQVDDVVDQMALGIDMTLRDVQNEVKKAGKPWLIAKGFPNAAVITDFRPFPGVDMCTQTDFALTMNGEVVQRGNIRDMVFGLHEIIAFVTDRFGLGTGDVIFTGTPAGVGPLSDGDRLELIWGKEILGACTVRLA